MAMTPEKTIGLILLVIIVFSLVFLVTPFIFAPFGIFPGVFHFMKIPDWNIIRFNPSSIFRFASLSFMSLALLVIWIMVIVWVYRDAERRGMNGVLWALLVLIGNLIGLLIYLIVRSESVPAKRTVQTSATCPSCQKPVNPTFVFCPNCGARLQTLCPKCHKPVESNWLVCPHCGEKLKSGG